VYVSTFRSSRVLVLDQADEIIHEGGPDPIGGMTPTVGWRMTEWPGKGVYVSHQRSSEAEIIVGEEAPPNGYGEGTAPIVETGGTILDELGEVVETASDPGSTLPVDADVNETGTEVAYVAASSDGLMIFRSPIGFERFNTIIPGEPIAVHYANDDQDIIVQTRQPSTLVVVALDLTTKQIELGGGNVADMGHAIFHRTPDGPIAFGVACASCHPEGREDGHVWNFFPLGARRTQSLLGGIASTKPFHWDGDQKDLTALLDEVFAFRMGNRQLTTGEIGAFTGWLDTLDDLPVAKASASELDEGEAAFVKAGCDACHGGERLTSGGFADVGTGGTFQIPSLIGVRHRAPFMHDGCAPTLADRFGPCGGEEKHGEVGKLTDGELEALIRHLETL
jgi:mono/diheme cytochrome c family protein